MAVQVTICILRPDSGDPPTGACGYFYGWMIEQRHLEVSIVKRDKLNGVQDHPVDVFLIESSRRGSFPHWELAKLRQWFPMALFMEITNDWSIGESRSGNPLPITLRVSGQVAYHRLHHLFGSVDAFMAFRENILPLSSQRDLFPLWNRNCPDATITSAVNLVSQDKYERTAIRDLLWQHQFQVKCFSRLEDVNHAGIKTHTLLCTANRRELVRLMTSDHKIPSMLIANHADESDLLALGNKGLLQYLVKPFVNFDLLSMLNSLDRQVTQQAA